MIQSIQLLRGLAALMVVLFHYLELQLGTEHEKIPLIHYVGGAGVDIFFVISGFIMTTSSSGHGPAASREFLFRRLVRIVPLYWTLTALAFALALLSAPTGVTAGLGWRGFFSSLAFLPVSDGYVRLNPAASATYVLPMAWTLTFEWYFYALFALSMLWGISTARRIGLLVAWFFVVTVVGAALQPRPLMLQVLTNPMSFEFVFGCAVALLHQRGVRWSALASAAAVAVAVVMLFGGVGGAGMRRIVMWGGAGFLLVAAAALTERGRLNSGLAIFEHLGDISYSVYLSHFFSLSLFAKLQAKYGWLSDGFSWWAIVAFAALMLLTAELCYRFIELPARRHFSRRQRGLRGAVTSPQ